MFVEFTSVTAGYLLGSIPSAYIMGRLSKGIDIRKVGGGNMSAANVMRQVGKLEGAIVALADIGKGAAAIFIGQHLSVSEPWLLATGFAAILGHNFPLYIGFKGGQGVATAMGVFLVITPQATLITCGLIALTLIVTHHIFSSVAISAPFFLLSVWFIEGSTALTVFALIIVMYIGFRSHHGIKEVIVTVSKHRKNPS